MAQNGSPDIVIDSGYLSKPVPVNQFTRSTDTFSLLLCRWKYTRRENYQEKVYSIREETTLMSPVPLGIRLS